MTKVVDTRVHDNERPLIICDFSPPRGGMPQLLELAKHLDVDFISVAYNPGKSTRVNSIVAAHWIKSHTRKDVIFTLATRDMNRVAIQSLLLGAQLLGLENLVVVKGDDFTDKELSVLKDVNDFKPSDLVLSINNMNRGVDFKGLKLTSSTDFCIGASIDMGREMDREIALTRRKVEAGVHFFITQPTFSTDEPKEFMTRYSERYGEKLSIPIFHGVMIMSPTSIAFGKIPKWITEDLAKGRTGEDIALHLLRSFTEAGLKNFYLVPTVLRGGQRDYEAAQAVLEAFRA